MTIAKRLCAALLALLLAGSVLAQTQRTFSQAELDQMLAPVALYPDPLLSQVLMAATYPAQVSEAARWSRSNPGLQGDDAVRAVEFEDWDPSVKSLVAFPQLLARMDEKIDWTLDLSGAFLAQKPLVMDTVQQLRRRAQAAGNLQSSEQLYVQQQGQAILIQPASLQTIYLPYYDPLVVYGPWWWPAYRPVAWAPWPGYARPYHPGVSVGFWWGRPIGLSLNFFFGNFDWHRHQLRVVNVNNYYYRPPVIVNRTVVVDRGRWQHDPLHRRGVDFRATVQAQPAARVQAQPQVQQNVHLRTEQREQRREVRESARIERREARQEQRAPAAQIQATPQAQVQPQARMPAAVAPQQPRAERQERRETRQEPRHERGPRGRERS